MDDFSATQSAITSSLVSTTRSAAQLAAEDIAFHRSLDPSISTSLDQQNERLLGLATRLLGAATAHTETVRPPSLKDVDGIENNWRTVVDVIDSLLERADTALDEFAGAVRRLSPGAYEQAANAKPNPRHAKTGLQQKGQDISKPQLLFDNVPTNRETSPFKPLLQNKPHSSTPLVSAPISTEDGSRPFYPHPYQSEIEQYQYPAAIYSQADPVPFKSFDTTTAILVDTEEAMEEMLQELREAKEIAVDLEHHDQRSYIGIVSLMQISTREKDWIVDTLKPWRRKLQCLNEVLADPTIIKVLHGAYMDIVWLQRDLGLYVVGLFDTHYAARALGYSGGSLAFLLKKFVNVDAQKQYQTSDWRVRPLPQELFDYARSDTHYLLYIFDCMRNELIERSDFSLPDQEGDKIRDVLQRSSETALQRYENPIYDPELGQGSNGWYKILSRTPAIFSKEQFSVFQAVHEWRDNVAREQDDSVNWVLPNHQIFTIARELPATRVSLLGIAQPTTQTVRLRADELVAVIQKAREKGKDGPEMIDVLNRVEPQPARTAISRQGANSHSVAPFLPQLGKSDVTNSTLAPSLPLRSRVSSFWGGSFESSAHQAGHESMIPDVSLSIPLPPLTAEVFADGPPVTPATPSVQPSAHLTPEHSESNAQDDDIFVLKQMHKKRKRVPDGSIVDGMAAQSDEVSIPDHDGDMLREKAERRKARKAEKRARRKAEGNATGSEFAHDEEEQPFDYTSAPSILTQPVETREEMKARRKKEVNPYAKALETAKGLPRIQKERAGRSMTYK